MDDHQYFIVILAITIVFGVTHTSASSIAAADECPRNWTRYDRTKSCFMIIRERMRWSDAERQCMKWGAHLAAIVDEYENIFAFGVAKDANLSVPTVWLGKIVQLTKTGAYEWHDGSVGRQTEGFRGELPTSPDLCMSMWLDFDRPAGSWNEWDCAYATGYSSLCKRSLKTTTTDDAPIDVTTLAPSPPTTYTAHRCCQVPVVNCSRCRIDERCILDDFNCLVSTCPSAARGWCLPVPDATVTTTTADIP